MRKLNRFQSQKPVKTGEIGLGMHRSACLALEPKPNKVPVEERMLGSGKTWMAAEEELLERECEAGVPIGEIAMMHRRTYVAIIMRLKQLRLVHPDLANSAVELQETLGKGRITLL